MPQQVKVTIPRRVLREFPDRGGQWTLTTIVLIAPILRLVRPALAARLDFSRARRMPRTYIPPALRKQENDILWFIPYRDQNPAPDAPEEGIYFLTELQTQHQRLQVLRALVHAATIWDQEAREWTARKRSEGEPLPSEQSGHILHPVVCAVLHTGADAWANVRTLRELMSRVDEAEDTIPPFTVLLLRAAQLTEAELAGTHPALSAFLRVMRVRTADPPAVRAALAQALADLARLGPEEEETWLRVMHFCTMFVWSERTEAEQEDLVELLADAADSRKAGYAREVRNVAQTMREVIIERTRQQVAAEFERVRQQDAQERLLEMRGMLVAQVLGKLGEVPEDLRDAVGRLADPVRMRELATLVAAASTPAEVRNLLAGASHRTA